MSIKKSLTKFLPSLRARDSVVSEIDLLKEQLARIEKRLDQIDHKNETMFFWMQKNDGETDLDVKKRVFFNLPKASGRVRDFQIGSDYILKRLRKLCDENNICILLDGGTLLGAVRHKGFIPWDDDVDVMMFREDFRKLESLLQDDEQLTLKRYYRYKKYHSDPSYLYKVKLKGSDQFFVDVFVLDYLDAKDGCIEKVWEQTKQLNTNFQSELQKLFAQYEFKSDYSTRPILFPGLDGSVKELEERYITQFYEQFNPNNNTEFFCYGIEVEQPFRDCIKILSSSDFLPVSMNIVEFEGIKYNTFCNYDRYLRVLYGDYWSIPKSIEIVHAGEFSNYSEEDERVLKTQKDKGKSNN